MNRKKFICPNESCINKSSVYRNINGMNDFTCKACGTILKSYVTKYEVRANVRAKAQLKELELT